MKEYKLKLINFNSGEEKMKNILVIISNFEHGCFFYRMEKSLKKKEYNLIFVTSMTVTFFYLKYHGCNVYLARNCDDINIECDKLKETIDFKMGKLGEKEVYRVYKSIYIKIKEIYSKMDVYKIFLWNGNGAHDLAGIKFAGENNIGILFFELANIPGRIFVDRKGTNVGSELYQNKEILNFYDVNEYEYVGWKKSYLEEKMKQHVVLQAKKRKNSILISILNIMGFYIYTHIGYSNCYLMKKISSYRKNTKGQISYDVFDYVNKKYIFFPLQVSCDTQILIHSDISLLEALMYAINQAGELNISLVIKMHPAEQNLEIFKDIILLKKKYDFYLSNENTFFLIKHANKIITINSTVGLEAMIMKKRVEVLGHAFYEKFSQDDLKKYILGYLVNIDFFSSKEITNREINGLINRFDDSKKYENDI